MICTYNELKESMSYGEEFDFYIGENRYGISRGSNETWCLAKYGSEEFQYFDDYMKLLDQAKIDGKYLRDIWHNARI